RVKPGALAELAHLFGLVDVKLDVVGVAARVTYLVEEPAVPNPPPNRRPTLVALPDLLVPAQPAGVIEVEHDLAAGANGARKPGQRFTIAAAPGETQAVPKYEGPVE